MENSFKISVVMATYNGSRYLEEQLQSLSRQSRLPDELIVSDDSSSDNTFEILSSFQLKSKFPCFLFKNPSERGYASNFNNALIHAKGDIVLLCDQDDYWYANKIEEIESYFMNYKNTVLLMNDALLTDQNLSSSGITKLSQIRTSGLPITSFVMGCCMSIRKDFLRLILPIPKNCTTHDGWIASFADGLRLKTIHNQVLQYYRRHDKNESKFIANRLKPVGRWAYLLNGISLLPNYIKEKNDLTHKKYILSNVREILKHKKIDFLNLSEPDDYNNFFTRTEANLAFLELRCLVREERFIFKKIFLAFSILLRGAYRGKLALVDMLKDIISIR